MFFVLDYGVNMFKTSLYNWCKSILKPMFHWKLGLRWLPNANEINTKNMKCTCPTPAPCVGDPMPPIFNWLALGVGVGGNANFSARVGSNANLVFLDTNMLISPTRDCGVGGLSQCEDPTGMFLRRSGI